MIVQLTGTLVEAFPTHAVLDVGGVGYELGISANTAASLPAVGEAGVTLYTRLIVREDAMELYGFATRQERALFDRLISISRVGPSLALSTLSTFTPQALATVVATQDVTRMTQVSGVGKKNAQRILSAAWWASAPSRRSARATCVRRRRAWLRRRPRRCSAWASRRRRRSSRSRASTSRPT